MSNRINIHNKNKNKKLIKTRKSLEKYYTRLAIHHGYVVDQLPNGRHLSISATAYYHVTGINADGDDIRKTREANVYGHYANYKRVLVEKRIKEIIQNKNCIVFREKEFFQDMTFEEINKYFSITKRKRINKQCFNELKNLFNKFSELSKTEHYSLNNAEKRINKKNMMKTEMI